MFRQVLERGNHRSCASQVARPDPAATIHQPIQLVLPSAKGDGETAVSCAGTVPRSPYRPALLQLAAREGDSVDMHTKKQRRTPAQPPLHIMTFLCCSGCLLIPHVLASIHCHFSLSRLWSEVSEAISIVRMSITEAHPVHIPTGATCPLPVSQTYIGT